MFISFPSCTINCHLCVIVLFVTIIALSCCGITVDYKYVNSNSVTMPVTTRSKTRLLNHSCNERPQVCLACSPVSFKDSSITLLPSEIASSSNAKMNPSTISSNLISEQSLTSTTSITLNSSSLVCDSSSFKFRNLEFSNSQCEATQSGTASDTLLCHNFQIDNNISPMEVDCQDTKMECPSDPPDLMQQLFTSLTTHILLQTDRIQKQIQQNDAKLTAAQDMFKEEGRNELDAFRALLATQIAILLVHLRGSPLQFCHLQYSHLRCCMSQILKFPLL